MFFVKVLKSPKISHGIDLLVIGVFKSLFSIQTLILTVASCAPIRPETYAALLVGFIFFQFSYLKLVFRCLQAGKALEQISCSKIFLHKSNFTVILISVGSLQ